MPSEWNRTKRSSGLTSFAAHLQCVRWTRTSFRLLKLRPVLASVRGACALAYLGGACLGIPAKNVGAFGKPHAPDSAHGRCADVTRMRAGCDLRTDRAI